MMYAARVMQLANELFGLELEEEYVNILKQCQKNRQQHRRVRKRSKRIRHLY